MGSLHEMIAQLKHSRTGAYWASRLEAELEYAQQVSQAAGGEFDDLIESAFSLALKHAGDNKAFGEDEIRAVECALSPMTSAAKSYEVICAAHAHIDMNWMWRFDETVAITIDTFSTMLQLMDEYPDFHFSQSQASVYKIVEEYAPELLEPIKARVKEGRWEVIASAWVEADKNMPNGESMTRHILYTRRYLSGLLGIAPESLDIDFEPDTFGHNINVPEVLASAGIKYYYHCRGAQDEHIRRWKSPSGRSIILYREPLWYNGEISPGMAVHVPQFCSTYGVNKMLKVYGVGDHGGGPTRRDLTRALDMKTWPIFPTIRFGTFRDWFRHVDCISDKLPEFTGELNFIFTGCYTSQSRIKSANRRCEALLTEAEAFSALGRIAGCCEYRSHAFAEGWQNTLFNQFHDIIPGSGTVDTREYAMGLAQKTLAASGAARTRALRSIAEAIDTSGLLETAQVEPHGRSIGAGVGYGSDRFHVSQVSRGEGGTRVFAVFNPSDHDRSEIVELILWDYNADPRRIRVQDAEGTIISHQVVKQGRDHYWGHDYLRLLIPASVSAFGYNTYSVTESMDMAIAIEPLKDPRVEAPQMLVLENDLIKVELDQRDCTVSSIISKTTGENLVPSGEKSGLFRFIMEDDGQGMTAWRMGRHMSELDITEGVRLKETNLDPSALRQYVRYEVPFSSSTLSVELSLERGAPRLDYSVECHWHEMGRRGKGIPSLRFIVPLPYPCHSFRYDVPFGTVDRQPMDMDVPANSIAQAVRDDEDAPCIALVSDSKYGYRGTEEALSVSLIRGSYDPDPYPEIGVHRFRIGILVLPAASKRDLVNLGYDYNHPLSVVSTKGGRGTLPPSGGFLTVSGGSAIVSSVKMPEDDRKCDEAIVRLYEVEGKESSVVLSFRREVSSAQLVNLDEVGVNSPLQPEADGKSVCVKLSPYSLVSVRIQFK